jgi:iron complex transport system substrate-binding protein
MKTSRLYTVLAVVMVTAMLLGACVTKPTPAATATSTGPTSYPAPTTGSPATNSVPTSYPAPTAVMATATQPAATVAAASGSITVTDGLNRTVTLAAPATKVVSLAASNTEILYEIGAGPLVVGRDEFSDYPAEAKNLPSVGGSMGKYDLEAIANLKPDLVLAAGINTPDQVKSLEDLKLTVFYLANPTDINGLYTNLQMVAKLVGKDAEAATLIDSLKKRYAAVVTAVSAATSKPKVYYELDATDPTKPYTAGPGSFVDQLITAAGGQNIGGSMKDAWAQISQEQIISLNPDVILLGDAAYGTTPDSVAKRPGWDALAAVKNNQVFAFDDNLVSRPDARMIDGLEAMAKLIHPDLFK